VLGLFVGAAEAGGTFQSTLERKPVDVGRRGRHETPNGRRNGPRHERAPPSGATPRQIG